MSKLLQGDSLLKLVASLLLALLVWQGKTLCDRIGSLERNQVRIMVTLGIEPIALEPHETPGVWESKATASENRAIQTDRQTPGRFFREFP